MIAYMLANASQGLYLFPARSFPVSPQLTMRVSLYSSDNNRTPKLGLLHAHVKQALSAVLIYSRAFYVSAKNSALVIAYTLVSVCIGFTYVSCKVIPSFSATRREGKFVLF